MDSPVPPSTSLLPKGVEFDAFKNPGLFYAARSSMKSDSFCPQMTGLSP